MDLIDRQDAIDTLRNHFTDGFEEDRWWNSTHVLAVLKDVPSTESEIIYCKDCKHHHTYEDGISVSWCDLGYSREIDISDEWFCADAERRTDE